MAKELDLSIVIAFYNHGDMTIQCVKSLYEFGPAVKEIVLVSNNSSLEELELVKTYAATTPNTRVLVWDYPFNYQKEYNWGIKQSTGSFVLMMNNDVELTSQSVGLIEKMYNRAKQKNTGATGCLLLYGDRRTIQHAGVFLMPSGLAEHLYVAKRYSDALRSAGTSKYPYDVRDDRPMTAVTGAVTMVERKKFDAVGGFDERFIICGGDVDLCLRLNQKGYQTWYVGEGFMLHKESQSRKFTPVPYNDFYWSYLSYSKGFSSTEGDPFLPAITKEMR